MFQTHGNGKTFLWSICRCWQHMKKMSISLSSRCLQPKTLSYRDNPPPTLAKQLPCSAVYNSLISLLKQTFKIKPLISNLLLCVSIRAHIPPGPSFSICVSVLSLYLYHSSQGQVQNLCRFRLRAQAFYVHLFKNHLLNVNGSDME